ncbi:MAG: hypothetical protein RL261_1243 [Pseudomonadota bacterium]
MNSMNARQPRPMIGFSALALAVSLLVGCGGGGSSSSGGGPPVVTTGTLSGTATKGPVSGAAVKAFAINNGAKGNQLGSATTDASGNFTMSMDAYSGPVMLQVHGGSYLDEATGVRMNMLDADELTCVVPAVTVSAGSTTAGVQVTPLTSMAQAWAEQMAGGMTMANATMANSRIGAAYVGPNADIVMMHPIDPTVAGSANGASLESKNYGMMLAAMSQAARDLGMTTSSSAMVTAMLDDASDGIMDGRMGGTVINMNGMGGMMGGGGMMATAGTSQLATSMATFINNMALNRSGVTSVAEMQSLMNQMMQLAASGGRL